MPPSLPQGLTSDSAVRGRSKEALSSLGFATEMAATLTLLSPREHRKSSVSQKPRTHVTRENRQRVSEYTDAQIKTGSVFYFSQPDMVFLTSPTVLPLWVCFPLHKKETGVQGSGENLGVFFCLLACFYFWVALS